MYLPVADHVGYAFEHAVRYLVKRADEAQDEPEPFELTHTQWVTIYWVEACVIVLLFSWNLYIARSIIFPFKLCAVACHEGCHGIAGTLTGAKVESLILDPNQGGSTRMVGGWAFVSLPAGYIGSTLIGAALIFAGFDQKASKIAAIPLFVHLSIVCFWARTSRFTLLNVTFIQGLILILYIVQHGAFLRFLLLLIGCMNGLPAQVWGAIWTTVSCFGLTAAILGGIVNFKDDFAAQYFNAQTFLPT
ncbi:hypothetical protein Rhopal_002317-T1 [Rhodotorula paludigena]|uniref:Peptidase M50B-like-domain-containing protein n=1 Tax=Rhodotorula paludigena TaxID=86838 RepID=A0AAV5GJ19_9BASI|nr:hypothetical protein Rhopal_002317-T1 [Rhodotorula paludigena]